MFQKKIKVCMLESSKEWKQMVLYKENTEVGVWNKAVPFSDTPEVSIDNGVVDVIVFSPQFISGFSINVNGQEKPFIDRVFKEFRVSTSYDNAVNSIVLSSTVDHVKGSMVGFNPSEVSLVLSSVGRQTVI